MFKDYYEILSIPFDADAQTIKKSYRALSLKWHPDKNPNKNVTEMMQDINEAYKILNNDSTRLKYDKEYEFFSLARKEMQTEQQTSWKTSWNYNYDITDEELKEAINSARAYAKSLVDEFLKSFKETSKVAVRGAWDEAYRYILFAIVITIIIALIRACY